MPRKLVLTNELADAIRDVRLRQKLNVMDGAAFIGVSEKVFKRWCRELGLNMPMRLGRPCTSSPERRRMLQREWKANNRQRKLQNA